MRDLLHIKHMDVRWSNFLINAAIDCSLLEKRVLYFISAWVMRNFTEKNLGVPDNWHELYFEMTDADLGAIGGKKNIPRTYEALLQLGKKCIPISYVNDKGEHVTGRIHWIDAFFYNKETKTYSVRVSPEILPYMINVKRNYTILDVGEAMTFQSTETQKMYELLTMYDSFPHRYTEKEAKAKGYTYAKNVYAIDIERFRQIFDLHEVVDDRTGKSVRRAKYSNFNAIKTRILERAQKELYQHYKCGTDCIWFDFQVNPDSRQGRKVKKVILYIYSKDTPKKGEDRPWQESDEPLCPYEQDYEEASKLTPQQKMHANPIYSLDANDKLKALADKLKEYFEKDDINYYMAKTMEEMQSRIYNKADAVMNVIYVIHEKEQQHKFSTKAVGYQRYCLKRYVFTKNMLEYFGWSIPPRELTQNKNGGSKG